MRNYSFLTLALSLVFNLSIISGVSAQVIPDSSLPEDSKAIREGDTITIEGGTKRGSNLFHSFREFSITELETVIINNPIASENIFLRVTGEMRSFIDGTLKSLGEANLFLMNPNGISFDSQATLEVGGDFIATTARGITFADGREFLSERQSKETSLLSISRPIGLEMFEGSGSIEVNNVGHRLGGFTTPFTPITLEENPIGLRVPSGNSIILVGNGINFTGGILTAKSGQIQMWSVGGGFVSLEDSNVTVREWGSIRLNQRSLLDASSLNDRNSNSGNISLYSRTIELDSASVIISQNESLKGRGGDIKLYGADSIVLRGVSRLGSAIFSSLIISSTLGTGDSGEIEVETGELSILDGSRFGTRSYGTGNSGDIRIRAESINLEGASPLNPMLTSGITSNALSKGNSGSIFVVSDRLNIRGGSLIGSVTLSEGDGGNVSVRARSIEIRGNSPVLAPSSISGTTFNQGTGGSLDIEAGKIYVLNGAAITILRARKRTLHP